MDCIKNFIQYVTLYVDNIKIGAVALCGNGFLIVVIGFLVYKLSEKKSILMKRSALDFTLL